MRSLDRTHIKNQPYVGSTEGGMHTSRRYRSIPLKHCSGVVCATTQASSNYVFLCLRDPSSFIKHDEGMAAHLHQPVRCEVIRSDFFLGRLGYLVDPVKLGRARRNE